jgi:hypothetical protein
MFYINPDGSMRERIYLNVDDKRQRETIICTHFLQFCARHIIGDTIGINVLSRDDPWDFRLELSTGSIINLEIVSIADNALQHRVNSHQALFEKLKFQERVRIRDLQKRATEFP